MKLAILFWCYKEPELCRDRVALLRRENPRAPIFVLYGGAPEEAASFRAALADLCDDFYAFEDPPPPGAEDRVRNFRGGVHWKYVFGDLLIRAWHRDRGTRLEWDTVVVVQWDMLVFGPLERAFACLRPGEALFSGLRPVREVEESWAWVAPSQPAARATYLEFLAHVRERHGYAGEPLGYLAIVTCLPRAFLDRFVGIERPELGFLEYRLPIYAQVFGTPLCREHPFRPWWGSVEPYSRWSTLRARPVEVQPLTILANLARGNGARVFHPYWHRAPVGPLGWLSAFAGAIGRTLAIGKRRARDTEVARAAR
jgi:hypothetical protein